MNEQPAVSEVVPQRKRMSTAAERSEWLRRYRESGLSVLQFCDAHKLAPQTFYQWLAKNRLPQGAAMVSTVSQPLAAFTEIKLEGLHPPCAWAAELQRPSGLILRVGANLSGPLLEQLLRLC